MWSRIFPQIDLKKNQSPIRIYMDQCEYEPNLAQRPFQIDIDENCCQTLENTGRSFQVSGKGYSRMFSCYCYSIVNTKHILIYIV